MEIRLNCFNSVELNGFTKLKNIKLEIISYNLNGNVLSGDVKTTGEYYKQNDEKSKGFEDIVPFEIVFRDSNIKVDKIFIENELFTFKETVGIKMQYEIVVQYSLIETDNKEDEIVEEVPVEIDEEYVAVSNVNNTEKEECIISNNVSKEEVELTNYYDNKLDEAFNNREINSNIIGNNKEKLSFLNQKSSYKTITVYYLNKENEIETISKEKRISLTEIYKNNDDFSKTHRLIINE